MDNHLNIIMMNLIKNFIDRQPSEWDYNKRTLQSLTSDLCGQYCLFYICQRSRGHSLSKIVHHLFSNNTLSNDAKVFQFFNNHFRTIDKYLYVNHNQTNKKRTS